MPAAAAAAWPSASTLPLPGLAASTLPLPGPAASMPPLPGLAASMPPHCSFRPAPCRPAPPCPGRIIPAVAALPSLGPDPSRGKRFGVVAVYRMDRGDPEPHLGFGVKHSPRAQLAVGALWGHLGPRDGPSRPRTRACFGDSTSPSCPAGRRCHCGVTSVHGMAPADPEPAPASASAHHLVPGRPSGHCGVTSVHRMAPADPKALSAREGRWREGGGGGWGRGRVGGRGGGEWWVVEGTAAPRVPAFALPLS